MKRFFSAILLTCFLVSCSQKPAPIQKKGNLYFGKNKSIQTSSSNEKTTQKRHSSSSGGASSSKNYVIVEKGDTLYSIARERKVSIRKLIEANNLQPPYILYPGNKVRVPLTRKSYIVVKGDSLTSISRKYNTSITELAKINNFDREKRLRIGEVIILPYSSDSPAQTSVEKATKVVKSIAQIKKTTFIWPVKGTIIRDFGEKSNGVSADGINIKARFDSAVKAANGGRVAYVGSELRGYGNLIIIKHSGNWLTAYAHNNNVYVTKGQVVKQGETIATVGKTGNVEESQLHFGLRKGKKPVDPKRYLK